MQVHAMGETKLVKKGDEQKNFNIVLVTCTKQFRNPLHLYLVLNNLINFLKYPSTTQQVNLACDNQIIYPSKWIYKKNQINRLTIR